MKEIRELINSGEVMVIELPFKNKKLKGLCVDNIIYINSRHFLTRNEKRCLLAEEIGHYKTSYGDILNTKDTAAAQQERIARAWGYNRLVSPNRLIAAYKDGIRGKYALSEYLEVTETYLQDAIDYYKSVYGTFKQYDNFIIHFEPLRVTEINVKED